MNLVDSTEVNIWATVESEKIAAEPKKTTSEHVKMKDGKGFDQIRVLKKAFH